MFNKMVFFISSYIPLFIILIIKTVLSKITAENKFILSWSFIKDIKWFNSLDEWICLFLVMISIMSYSFVIYQINHASKSHQKNTFKIITLEDRTSESFLNYISVYLISFLNQNLNSIVEIFILISVMCLIGFIYIFKDLIYINPILYFKQYNLCKATLCEASDLNKEMKNFNRLVIYHSSVKMKCGSEFKGILGANFIFAKSDTKEN